MLAIAAWAGNGFRKDRRAGSNPAPQPYLLPQAIGRKTPDKRNRSHSAMARPASRKAVSSLPAIANIDEQLDEVVMSDWISVEERTPENQDGKWSKDVIALSDSGDVFRLACMGGYWQRTQSFIDAGATKVTHWMPLIYPDD